jgi:hypothetical protein
VLTTALRGSFLPEARTATLIAAVQLSPCEPPQFDVMTPQDKLQLAREILFMVASAEHAVKNAPKVIEGTPASSLWITKQAVHSNRLR